MTAVHTFHSHIKDMRQKVHEEVKQIQVKVSQNSGRLQFIYWCKAGFLAMPHVSLALAAHYSFLQYLTLPTRRMRCNGIM